MSAWQGALFFLFLACLAFSIHCGGDSSSSGEADDDDASSEDDDQSDDDDDDDDPDDDDEDDDNNDDDDDHDDDDDDDDDEWDIENRWGSITVSEGVMSSNLFKGLKYFNYAAASFSDPEDFEGTIQDPVESEGPCDRYVYDDPSPDVLETKNGGVVTITGAAVSPIHLTPVSYAYGYYYEPDYDPFTVSDLFDAGDVLEFSTVGQGGIPAFSGSLKSPAPVQIQQPSNFDSLASLPQGDFTIAWKPSDGRWVVVMVSSYNGLVGSAVVCSVDDEDGQVTISRDLMEDLDPTPDSLTIGVTRTAITRDSADGKDLDFQITTYRQRGYYIVR